MKNLIQMLHWKYNILKNNKYNFTWYLIKNILLADTHKLNKISHIIFNKYIIKILLYLIILNWYLY